ncbi:hypothetical protein K402DRAFT_265780 [Aulographum hederae CBS 113979]|uniref:Peptidase S8/S53 domain-containing protein n=1 Tax=Aulographum hederae CBS 113979 TaxID=1176131 RepID=A0A6G1GJ60_9PEZI|nr:hypothetical protein K402DRAFT_265780 [Aulographum hederae CBS 113979]
MDHPPPPTMASDYLKGVRPRMQVTIGEDVFILPIEGAETYEVPDNSRNSIIPLELRPDSVVYGPHTYSIGILPEATIQPSSGDGTTISSTNVKVAESHTSSGLKGLFNLLGTLAFPAATISDGLDGLASRVADWAQDTTDAKKNAQLADAISNIFNKINIDLDQVGPGFEEAVKKFGNQIDIELQDLGANNARETFIKSFPKASELRNRMNMVKRWLDVVKDSTNPHYDQALQLVKNQFLRPRTLKAGGALIVTGGALRAFAKIAWTTVLAAGGNQVDESPTLSLPSTSATTTSTTSSSSTPSATPTRKQCFVMSKRHADRTVFKQFTEELDGGVGDLTVSDAFSWQTYRTFLNQTELDYANSKDFVNVAGWSAAANQDWDEWSHTTNTSLKEQPIDLPKPKRAPVLAPTVKRRSGSENHLKLISQKSRTSHNHVIGKLPPDDYTYDELLGKGSTIYVFDTGFNMFHEDFALNGRKVDSYVVPNTETLPGIPEDLQAPEDMTDYKNHGTGVASVAGGLRYGVASKANLCLIKISNCAKNPQNPGSGRYLSRVTTADALIDAFEHAFRHIAERRANGDKGYSIFSMSFI